MSFSLLPRELVLAIAKDLDPKSFNALLRACRSLAVLLVTLLRPLAFEPRGGMPAIIWAAGHGHEPLVRLLLDEGVHIETVFDPKPSPFVSCPFSYLRITALQEAVRKGDEATTKLLISRGANMAVFNRQSLLHLAVQSNNPEMVRLILQHRGKHIDINAGDKPLGRTALHLAVSNKAGDSQAVSTAKDAQFLDLSIAAILLEHGADMFVAETRYHTSSTACHLAAEAGNVAGVEFLLDNGFPIDMQSIHGDTILHMAAGGGIPGNKEVVRVLLDRGADMAVRQSWKGTALHTAKVVLPNATTDCDKWKWAEEIAELLEAEMASRGCV